MRATCENCGTPVTERFCTSCGQSTSTIDLPVAAFAREMASEALGLDSRVRRTIGPLFFRPGLIPREYVAGHRARFVPPVRLYLLASFFMFVTLSFGEFEVQSVEVGGRVVTADSVETPGEPGATTAVQDGGGLMIDLGTDSWNERLSVGFQRLLANPSGFNEIFIDRMAKSMFVLLPAFAGLLKLLWWERLYVHHLIFAIYFHSFVFFLVGAVGVPEALGFERVAAASDLLLLIVPVYLLLALRAFYADGWVKTVFKGVVVTGTYGIMGIATVMILLVVSVLSL